MAARHRSRQRALQVLFLVDLRHQPVSEAISSFYGTLTSEAAREDLVTLAETLVMLLRRLDPTLLGPMPLAAKFT